MMINKLIPGGHAIMLSVDVPLQQRLQMSNIAAKHALENMWGSTDYHDPTRWHATLQWVGRNGLSPVYTMAMIQCAFALQPIPIEFTGEFVEFANKSRNYVVAKVRATEELQAARRFVQDALHANNLRLTDSFSFNPHVTLVEGAPKPRGKPLPTIEPFTVVCKAVTVKYGERKMVVDL